MAGNPWQVESILAFYCLKCPECDFNTQEENNFVYHAKEYHPLSCVLFGQETTNGSAAPYTDFKEEINTAHIKQEQNYDLSYEDDYYNYPDVSMNEYENDQAIQFKTEFKDENDPLKASSCKQSIIYLMVYVFKLISNSFNFLLLMPITINYIQLDDVFMKILKKNPSMK